MAKRNAGDNFEDGQEPRPVMEEATPVVFTIDELWLLQKCIRHEIPAQETWKYPPGGLELNDQIAAAIFFCSRYGVAEAAIRLSWGDLLAIDFTVPPDAKDVNGLAIGRAILLKSFAARSELRRAYPLPEVAAEPDLDKTDVQNRLSTMQTRWDDDASHDS